MSTLQYIVQKQAIAEEEAKATIERLLGGGSERISMARYDAMSTPAFENAMIIAELVRIVDNQSERLEGLEKELAKATKAMKAMSKK